MMTTNWWISEYILFIKLRINIRHLNGYLLFYLSHFTIYRKSSQEKLTANIEKLGSSSSSLSSSSASSSVCDELTSDDNFDTNHHSSTLTSCTTNTTITTTGNGNSINGTINGKVPRIRSVNYSNNDHANNALSIMDFMRKNDRLCDVSLEVKGSHLKAHKVVLCATSAYFDAMFNSKYRYKIVMLQHFQNSR